ncbi:MAG: response regulator [Vampirovibrio sp.]|nr:response regulator [Vampirovibrio sp.]
MKPHENIIKPFSVDRVLMVDDDELSYVFIQGLFQQIYGRDFNLEWKASYEEGLLALEKNSYELCLVDYSLGQKNGLELIREVNRPAPSKTPFILLTGHDDYEIDLEASEAGAWDYLIKTEVNPSMLERSIRYTLKRKQMREKLLDAQTNAESSSRAKSDFLANMSHEIRTPINGIMGMAQLLSETDLTDEQYEYTKTIQSSTESLLSVINDILDFSKIEAGKLDIEAIPFNFTVAIEEMIDLITHKAIEKEFEFLVRLDPNLPKYVVGDPGRIRQVMLNFLTNAFKFTETGHVLLSISCEEKDEEQAIFNISVEDTGKGIDPEKLETLFDKFTQEDTSTTRVYGGTGLGLAICKSLLEMMEGEISAESTLGKGSIFSCKLPLRISKQQHSEAIVVPDFQNLRILVVDDHDISRQVITENLSNWQIDYHSVSNGYAALDKLSLAKSEGNPFQIAILDYLMPVMDGEELGRKIKQDPELEDTLLIMLTAYSQRRDVKRLQACGFSAYLNKPLSQSVLFDTIINLWTAHTAGESSKSIITRHAIRQNKKEPLNQAEKDDLTLSKPIRILLAEDNLVNQKVTVRILEKMGVKTDVAANGHEAIQMSSLISYELILMDCQMPEMNGFDATMHIRQRENGKDHTPIVALTANAMKGDREACLDAGMDDYLSKPVKIEELKVVIKRWVEDKQTA